MIKITTYSVRDKDGNYIATYRDAGYTIRFAERTPRAVAVEMIVQTVDKEEIWHRKRRTKRVRRAEKEQLGLKNQKELIEEKAND